MYCIHQTYSFRGLTLRVVETQIVANMTSERNRLRACRSPSLWTNSRLLMISGFGIECRTGRRRFVN